MERRTRTRTRVSTTTNIHKIKTTFLDVLFDFVVQLQYFHSQSFSQLPHNGGVFSSSFSKTLLLLFVLDLCIVDQCLVVGFEIFQLLQQILLEQPMFGVHCFDHIDGGFPDGRLRIVQTFAHVVNVFHHITAVGALFQQTQSGNSNFWSIFNAFLNPQHERVAKWMQ